MGGGRPAERRFTVGGSGKSVARVPSRGARVLEVRIHLPPADSPSLTGSGTPRSRTPAFPAGVRAMGGRAPIIDQALWDAVQAQLASNTAECKSGTRTRRPSLLAGLRHATVTMSRAR